MQRLLQNVRILIGLLRTAAPNIISQQEWCVGMGKVLSTAHLDTNIIIAGFVEFSLSKILYLIYIAVGLNQLHYLYSANCCRD